MQEAPKQLPTEDKHPGGRPLKFDTVEKLDMVIQNYFAMCDPHATKALVETGHDALGNMLYDTRTVLTTQKPYTMSGLARALGIDRKTLLNYKNRDEYFPTIKEALNRCEEYAESQLFGPFANGAKFSLNNNFTGEYQPWADKQVLAGDKNAPLMPIGLDSAIMARRSNGKTPPGTTEDSSEPDPV